MSMPTSSKLYISSEDIIFQKHVPNPGLLGLHHGFGLMHIHIYLFAILLFIVTISLICNIVTMGTSLTRTVNMYNDRSAMQQSFVIGRKENQ